MKSMIAERAPQYPRTGSKADLHHRFRAAVLFDDFGQEPFAQVLFRSGVVGLVALVLHDSEAQMIERAAHLVELVLGLHDDLVEAMLNGPDFLLLGERAKVPLPPPISPRTPDPGVHHPTSL